jgi:putative two-component system response regulator
LATAETGEDALRINETFQADLVLLDIVMPGIDGCETCRLLKSQEHGQRPQVMMVSARSSESEQLRAFEAGADDYLVKPFDPYELDSRIRVHFRLADAMQQVVQVRNEAEDYQCQLQRLASKRVEDLSATQDVAVLTLAEIAESRDQGTGQHLRRMRSYAQILAHQLQENSPHSAEIDDDFLRDLYRSSPLHDIGKVGISDAILLKPGPLTKEEFEIIKQHTIIGANILDQAVFLPPGGSFLAMASIIARFHHERYDGTGYPAGLSGEEIPLAARIVAVADVYDAVTSARPYKPAYPVARARQIIEEESGKHFDPAVVEAFRTCFNRFVQVGESLRDQVPLAHGAMAFKEHDQAATAACGATSC